MDILIATPAPGRLGAWVPILEAAGLHVACAVPERQALPGGAPEVALLDLVGEVWDLSGFRALLGQLYLGQSVGLIAVVRRQQLPALLAEPVDDVLELAAAPEEVVYRVRRVAERLRRRPPALRLGELLLHPAEGRVLVEGERVDLRLREFALLRFLCRHPNRVFRRDYLAREVWGPEFRGSLRTVDTHVCRLRGRLGEFGRRHLHTVRGIGYRLSVPGGSGSRPVGETRDCEPGAERVD